MRYSARSGRQFLAVGEAGSGFALAVEQPQAAAWRLEVRATLKGGMVRVGRLFLPAVVTRSRVVCVAAVPGARDWGVELVPADQSASAHVDVTAAVSECCAGDPWALRGGAEPGDETYQAITGAAGVVLVAAGDRVTRWWASATAPGATFAVNGGAAQPVPLNGFVEGVVPDGERGPSTFAFVGTTSYLVEVARAVVP